MHEELSRRKWKCMTYRKVDFREMNNHWKYFYRDFFFIRNYMQIEFLLHNCKIL